MEGLLSSLGVAMGSTGVFAVSLFWNTKLRPGAVTLGVLAVKEDSLLSVVLLCFRNDPRPHFDLYTETCGIISSYS